MSTVILKWNPGFSSYTMARFLGDLEKCARSGKDETEMNWSVWDFDKVHVGDTFYMLKVGYGQTGIVARGTLTSEAYAGEDWSWRGRPTKYCNLNFEIMINPDAFPLLDSFALAQAIPDFDWKGGHSGLVLTDEQAERLEGRWSEYLQSQAEYFDKASDHNLYVQFTPSESETPYTMKLQEDYRGASIVLKFTKDGLTHSLNIFNIERVLGKFGVKSWRKLQHFFYYRYPTTESLQMLCGELFKYQIEYDADFYRGLLEDDDLDE